MERLGRQRRVWIERERKKERERKRGGGGSRGVTREGHEGRAHPLKISTSVFRRCVEKSLLPSVLNADLS